MQQTHLKISYLVWGVDVNMWKDNYTNISWPWAGTPLYWQKACNTILVHLPSHSNTSPLYTTSACHCSHPLNYYLSLVTPSQLLLQSQSYITTDSQPVLVSGTCNQFFFFLEIFFRQLRICYFVPPSLMRGRVCNLLLLLILASTVPLRSAFFDKRSGLTSVSISL
jgi:hypothetical protein